MSLRKAKVLYCVSVMALALILAARAGGIGEIAAVILLAGALPAWALVIKVAETQGYISALQWAEKHLQHAEDQDAP